MKTYQISIPVAADEAQAYAAAPPEVRRDIDEALRRRLRVAIRQAPEKGDESSPEVEKRLAALAASGEVTRARRPKKDWKWRPGAPGLPKGKVQAILEDVRADRDDYLP